MAFETNRYNLQCFGEDMSILCTTGKLERFIVCYFWMVLVKIPNQQYFWEEDLSYTGVFLFLSRNWFKILIPTICVVDNLSVHVKTKDENNMWKIRPWLENLRQKSLKVFHKEGNSADKIIVPFKGRSYLRQYLPNNLHK